MYSEDDAAFDAWDLRASAEAHDMAELIDEEHRLMDEPSMVAFMRFGGETVWINAYPTQHMVTETYPAAPVPGYMAAMMPGCVREHPFAKVAGALTAKFAERVFAHEQLGYKHARPEGGR
jgi:hypothetical protein